MAIYLYETIPEHPDENPERFEVTQSMKDAPLTRHPDNGRAVRRIITGGYGFMGVSEKSNLSPVTAAASCAPGCACHSGPRIPQP
jgi:hypothetical protein